METMAPMVITPVPPMPATSSRYGASSGAGRGSGSRAMRARRRSWSAAGAALFARLAAHDRDEAGAESLHARIVLVAAGLVDGALTAVRGLQRHYRQAIRLHAAIAAALADGAVDQQAARRIRELVLLAAPALLGRAGLVVDQHGDAGRGAQLALHRVQVAAVVHLDAGAQGDAAVFSGSSVVTTMRATFSPRSCWQICGTDIGPSTGWPPVMATASLNRIL